MLLRRLSKIPEPRNPKKIKHTLISVMLYGLLVFVLQFGSRRQANTEITRPMFEQNLRLLFPELDSLPHADTLFRLLCRIEVNQIEQAHIDLVRRLIRKKKFAQYRINNRYPIAIDGTQKMHGSVLWCDQLQERRVSGSQQDAPEQQHYQYCVYVLEANLCFHNGMVIPLMSEFLDYQQGDIEHHKQDCELRAFYRLAERIKKAFPKLPIMLLLDGLYPNGPLLERCDKYNWDFMIVLKDDCLPSVWQEFHGLRTLNPKQVINQDWGKRSQQFHWVNDIRYEYGPNDEKHHNLNLVVCNEEWEEFDEQGERVTKTSKHAWISSRRLHPQNVHIRCNLGARHRWGIETCILVEKHQGYSYEHLFAKNWNAMRGYHYLMRLAHLLNTLARFSSELAAQHLALGIRRFIDFVCNTYSGPWFDGVTLEARMRRPFQLRLS